MKRAAAGAAISFIFQAGLAQADPAAELAKLRAEIDGLVGQGRCMNLVQCRVVPLGSTPCGGPAEYLAYSWISTDKAALETKIAEYGFLLEDVQGRPAAAGACVVPPEPVAACVNNRCVLSGSR
ncbi:MAG TPA: hypothetical protein VHA15_13940 [Burkholderiales bacterium]|jgi:hypothetical protein|nr:hypothetical protein [Burkholderiales bacterium]